MRPASLGFLTAALLAVVLLCAGCGSSGSTPVSSSGGGAKSTSSGGATTPASTGGSSPTFASVGNCAQLAGVGEKFAKALSSATTGGKDNLQSAVSAYQSLANAAPSAIRPALQVMSQAFGTFASALEKAGFKPGATPSASELGPIESAAKEFESPKLKSAENQLQAWAEKNCT